MLGLKWFVTLVASSSWERVVWIIVLTSIAAVAAGENRFDNVSRQPSGMVTIRGIGESNRVYQVEGSTNLTDWRTIATLIRADNAFEFLDPASRQQLSRFYRFFASSISATNDWQNQVTFPADPFAGGGEANAPIYWIKFIILPSEPYRVYYQDSRKYEIHYDFATARLQPFRGMARDEFDRLALHWTNQEAILGSVLFPPQTNLLEYAIQFSGLDPYPREWVVRFFEVVRSTVLVPPGLQPYYFPVYEQTEAAWAEEAFFAAQGIQIGNALRWVQGDAIYAAGWAFGRLKFIPANEINAAYADGRLKPEDILLTDGVPAEIPFVAGIVSLVPATPNSHVAILAGAYGVPFVYVAAPAVQERMRQLAGREIVLQGSTRYGISTIDVEGQLDAATCEALWQLKVPPRANIPPKARYGVCWTNAEVLYPSNNCYFGGKAANYGLLRRMLPTNSEPAIAFSFDLWDDFLAQTLPGGKTLQQTVQERLGQFTNYPPNISALQSNLAVIRGLITTQATFTASQRQTITNALAQFEASRKIRFRSSSNAEDSKTFAAAGLYDSFSGCLADDLDGDEAGPCHCDPTESKERGVFRAVQKVYASFYNDNAFLERLRHGIDEDQVGMALLVHYSAPDDIEMANGVAQMRRQQVPFGGTELDATLVTQAGAVSVTNPEGNAQPDIVGLDESSGPAVKQYSSLVPLGTTVLTNESEYRILFELMRKAYTNYATLVGYLSSGAGPLLDFEYKKVQPGQLIVKQVRELPSSSPTLTNLFLVNSPTTFWVFQGEQSRALANHRLKCRFTLHTTNLWLSPTNLVQCFYTDARFEYRRGSQVETITGSPATWRDASHYLTNDYSGRTMVCDRWTVGTGADQRTYVLKTAIPKAAAAEFPVLSQRDLRKWLEVTYATPVPTYDFYYGQSGTTNWEQVQLVESPDFNNLDVLKEETLATTNGLGIQMAFLDSEGREWLPGVDPTAWGYLPEYYSSWAQTTISGLLAQPIHLQDYYATSAAAGHKIYDWYVFEPALDPSLPQTQRDALETANVQLIYVERHLGATTVMVLGREGTFRTW
jgi:hypothetical protein